VITLLPNKRLKLAARVDWGMNLSSARRSLSAIRRQSAPVQLFIRAIVAWLAILLLAIINGALRQGLVIPRLGERAGHIISTILLSILVLVATWFLVPWVRPRTQ
jgi:hypothetical protein